jgi:hypothetical protein
MRKVLGCWGLVVLFVTLSAGTAVAKTEPPTVQQVQDQVQLVVQDEMDAVNAYQKLFDMPQAQSICQGQLEHVKALRAMVRPTRYPKAKWKILMHGARLYAKAASECVAAAQAAIATKGTGHTDTSGFPQVSTDWNAGNRLFTKASDALAKAKIH